MAVRSVMAGELRAFTDAFDAVLTIASDFFHGFNRKYLKECLLIQYKFECNYSREETYRKKAWY